MRRERIDETAETFLFAFREPAELQQLIARLAGFEPGYVQSEVAEWLEAGMICGYGPQSK